MRHIITLVAYLRSMKKTINGVLVVEGNNDISYISSLYDGLFVKTNGYEIPKEEIDFLNNLPESVNIYVLTDSDEAGKVIRERLNKELKSCKDVVVDINKCDKHGKHGVAECDKEELIKTLNQISSLKTIENGMSLSDLINLGVDAKEKRDWLTKELHLGICNNKTLLKRINYLNIKESRIREIMEKYGN